jgi:hypothetical protein
MSIMLAAGVSRSSSMAQLGRVVAECRLDVAHASRGVQVRLLGHGWARGWGLPVMAASAVATSCRLALT